MQNSSVYPLEKDVRDAAEFPVYDNRKGYIALIALSSFCMVLAFILSL